MRFALLVPADDSSVYSKSLNSDQERICLTRYPVPDFFVIVIWCLYKYSAVCKSLRYIYPVSLAEKKDLMNFFLFECFAKKIGV